MASWTQRLGDKINKLFALARKPMPSIPPILLLYEIKSRPGLSAMVLASAIIRRLPEAGIPTDKNPDGSDNKILQSIVIGCEEIVKEIKEHSVVSCAMNVGGLNVTISGGNTGGPIIGTGTNVAPFKMDGIVQ